MSSNVEYKVASICRCCTADSLVRILELSPMPAGDKFVLTRAEIVKQTFPSSIYKCHACGHIQMECSIEPSYIYKTYLSRPATTNNTLSDIYQEYAQEIRDIASAGRVLEVGSNDGLFLAKLKDLGVNCEGVEPAENLHEFATKSRGMRSSNVYFDENIPSIFPRHQYNVVFANHALSNIEDIRQFALNVDHLLSADGKLIVQTFYQMDVLKKKLIENYNHEHLSYFTLSSLSFLFSQFGLFPYKFKYIDAKGGSIRIYFSRRKMELDENSKEFKDLEDGELHALDALFKSTRDYIDERRSALPSMLLALSSREKIAAFGTSIGSTVFTYQFGLSEIIGSYFDDDNLRQGRFSPGLGIPVLPGDELASSQFDICLITAPLYLRQIMIKHKKFAERGGRFVRFYPDISVCE